MREIKLLMNRITSLVKFARLSAPSKDTADAPVMQVEFDGKTKDVMVLMPYGTHGVAPAGTLVVLSNIKANEENQVGIPTSALSRRKGLKVGEFVSGNFVKGNIIFYDENGNITLIPQGGGVVNIEGDLSVQGDVNVSGTVTAADFIAGGIPYTTHVHAAGSPTTGPPQ